MKAVDYLPKKAVPADVKFVETYISLRFNEAKVTAVNPFSRVVYQCNPLVANLVTFVQDLMFGEFRKEYLDKWGVPEGRKIQLFDRARMLILKLDNNIYMNVID